MEPERMREIYKECMKNHAAKLGTYAADGCCEYISDGSMLTCTACGCHRNFHRRAFIDYHAGGRNAVAGYLLPPPEGSRRRTRTKFTEEQKASMASFAEGIGWKMPKRDGEEEDDEVSAFCREIGVSRKTFKIWMHNHKGSPTTSSSTTRTDGSPVDGGRDGNEV
ncbi:zinc-finger homeodomain protein 11-like [Typha angustifolia]|uniref:zinc-finger homeodomain protein 11-like n=1 Tax=Typha angustifolia TaxID=59011 RepID=UPI003C2E0A72